ncbi:hypothetical protein [Pseudomonas fluorescens]|uniref:Uncharacterized protein n=1 Tax=Pseudomonas fluorescens TaxID=294 RepID=A0A5E7A7C2_PSEFL|nr:hypothetical protein [Pseudomonas fluorescens]VVN74219.1 hypothetical protein PS710_00636 [Pseudomonas fluorescens]
MIRLMVVLLLLTGCAQKETTTELPKPTLTTVYRYTSEACEPAALDNEPLRQAIKSRDQWKRYAESLEKLPGAK